METTDSKTISQLNDLIRVNNLRIEGYERAETDTDDSQLKSLFHTMAKESREYKNDLAAEVIKLGANPAEDTTAIGKIFKAWMDLKAAIAEKDRKSMIMSCEMAEEAALEIYTGIVENRKPEAGITALLKEQQGRLQKSIERIKLIKATAKSL